jgi:hypothetical protein
MKAIYRRARDIKLARALPGSCGHRPLALALACVASLAATPAVSASYDWLGNVGNWDDATQWSLIGVPGAGDWARIHSGAVSVTANRAVQRLSLSGGAIRDIGSLSVSGLTEYSGGTVGGFGGNLIANGGLSISGSGTKTLGTSSVGVSSGIVNNGAATWSGTGRIDNWSNGRFTNSATGTLDIQNDTDFRSGTLINQGRIVKSVGAGGVASTDITAQVQNTGTIEVDRGRLRVSSAFDNQGTVTTLAGAVFESISTSFTNSGILRGNGTIRTALNDDLVNNATIAPGLSTGTLTVDGDLRFGAGGRLQIELASLSDFDQLLITDDVSFGGLLEVVNAGYVPSFGDSFVIVRFDQRLSTNVFSGLNLVGWSPGLDFTVTYNLNDVTLTAVPEPGTWALWLAGLVGISAIARRRSPR